MTRSTESRLTIGVIALALLLGPLAVGATVYAVPEAWWLLMLIVPFNVWCAGQLRAEWRELRARRKIVEWPRG